MKPHQNKPFLEQKIAEGYTSKQIANECKVSYHLVELYLRKFDIPFTSQANTE